MLQPVTVGIYSFIILAGGMIGYIKHHSQASLMMALSFSILLAICSLGMLKNNKYAFLASKVLTGALLAFFTYRFYLKQQFMPAGLIALLSVATLAILFLPMKTKPRHSN